MRGNIKTDEYFEELLKEEDDYLIFLNEQLDKAIEEKGKDFPGVKNGYGFLSSAYQLQFDLVYTAGTRDKDLHNIYSNLLRYESYILEPKECSYWDMVKTLSLAILMKTDPSDKDLCVYLKKIREGQKLRGAQSKDYLVDKLCGYLDSSWPYHCETFRWKNTFELLKEVFENPDDDAVGKIDEFLRKRWLMIHRGASWYGGHIDDKKKYYGYWAYECAAVVKILGLDDTILNGQKWYPYDLAHMTD